MTNKDSHNYIVRATVIIAVFSVVSKILGLARDAIFSNKFGTSYIVDAYFAAFRIPDFVFNLLILGTFSVAFIPVFSEYMMKDKKAADRLASSILNMTLILMLTLSILAFIFIRPLISAIAPGFEGPQRELTLMFTKVFLLSPVFLTLSSIVSSMLNAHKKFALVAAAPVVYNFSIILGVVWFYPLWGNIGLALGVVLGAALHFLIQVPNLFKIGFQYAPVIEYRERGFIKFWKLYWPRIFSLGAGQITLLIATFFGSYLSTGSLSAFYYANNLQGVFLSVFAVSAALAVFPLMSDLYNQGDESGFRDVVAKTSLQILYFMIPLSALMLIMRAQIVRLILGIGQNTSFTFEDTRIVSLTLGLFAISLFAQGLIPFFDRAFYARQNTKIPVIISAITIVVNIGLTYYFVRIFGIPGMALAFSVSSIINLILLISELHSKVGSIHDEYLILNTLKILIATAVAGTGTFLSLYAVDPFVSTSTYFGILTQTGIAGMIGVVIFVSLGWLMGLSESLNLVKLLRSAAARFNKSLAYIVELLTY